MKNGLLTELVFILDASGSMHGLEADTIGGFNAMLEKQKSESGKAFVSTVVFNTESRVVHDRMNAERVEPITEREYAPSGCTALYDALGGAIRHISNIHKYARREDVPDRTLFVITTDGMENASRRYSGEDVKRMVEEKKAKDGWEFLFLGANIDAASEGAKIGIAKDRCADFVSDREGTILNYEVVSDVVSSVRANCAPAENWSERIDERTRRMLGR